MLIACPNCATSYDVELASLQPSGRQVRCVRCRTVWNAEPSQAAKLIAAADALAPRRRAAGAATQAFAAATNSQRPAEDPAAAMSEADWTTELTDGTPDYGQSPEALADLDTLQSAADADAVREDEATEAIEVEVPSIAPVDLDEGQPPIEVDVDDAEDSAEAHQDIETIAARRYGRRSARADWRWPLSRLQTGIMALVIVDSIIVGWRTDFVRAMPQTASFFSWMGMSVNLRGLYFEDIATATEQHDGVPILVVEGNIVNDARKIVDVPRLKFAVRNAAKQEIYSWTAVPSRTMLPPGEAVAFRTRLASPPPDGHDVLVRFINRRDVVAGDR